MDDYTTSNTKRAYAVRSDGTPEGWVDWWGLTPGLVPTPEETREMETSKAPLPPGNLFSPGSRPFMESWEKIINTAPVGEGSFKPRDLWMDGVRELSSVYATLTKWYVNSGAPGSGHFYLLFATIDGVDRMVSVITADAYENERVENAPPEREAPYSPFSTDPNPDDPKAPTPTTGPERMSGGLRFREAPTVADERPQTYNENAKPAKAPLCLRTLNEKLRGMNDRVDSEEYTLMDAEGTPFRRVQVDMDTKTIKLAP